MGVLVTRDLVRAFSATVKTVFEEAFEAQSGVWNELATLVPSEGPIEEYGWLSELPLMREFTDERVIKSLGEYGYTLRNRKFEATIAVAREVLEDDRAGQVAMRIRSMAEAASAHYDQLLFALIAGADTALGYDGKPFYCDDHAGGKEGELISNRSELPLTSQNLEFVLTAMARIPLPNGEPMRVTPTHLLVGPELRFAAKRLLGAAFVPGSGGAQVANPLQNELKLIVSPRLTEPSEWHVLDCSSAVKPFLIQQRIAPEFTALDGSDGEGESSFLRDEFLYGVRSRDNAGLGLWQYAYKCVG